MTISAQHSTPRADPGVIALALWFGIVGGLGEVVVHAGRRFIRHRFVFVSDDAVWMAPLAIFLLLLLIGVVLVGIQRLRHRPATRALVPGFLFLTGAGVLLSYPRLHWAASLVLAAGIAFQCTRWQRRHSARVATLVYATLPWLITLVVSLGIGLQVARRLTRVPSGPAPAAGSPNVLLIIFDTVRGLDYNGGDALASYFPRLSRRAASGIRFERAFSAAPWTLPSHATMFTGRWPHEHRANWDHPLDHRYPTLAEAMTRAGYVTAGFAANKAFTTRATGLSRGFQVYRDYLISPGEVVRSSTVLRLLAETGRFRRIVGEYQALARKNADQVNREVLDWLPRHGERPYFAFLNYFDAHGPYLPPPPFDSALKVMIRAHGGRQRWFEHDFSKQLPPPDILLEAKTAYLGGLSYLDDRVDALLDSLEQHGWLRNTWVILTADHGEEFGEHGRLGHGHNLYRTLVQVPLVIWGPGLEPATSSAPVSLRNIPATVMNWIHPGVPTGFPGTSLLQLMATGDSARSELIYVEGMPPEYSSGGGDMISWVQDSVRVIRHSAGKEELLPLSDPLEKP
jgi:arylsulfatase A-like enzyme